MSSIDLSGGGFTVPMQRPTVDMSQMHRQEKAETAVITEPVVATEKKDLMPQDHEEARFEMVKRAADLYVNLYAVRDHTVSIFKNPQGEYQFRLRNLQTGEVTQIPEPDILEFMSRVSGKDSMLRLDV